MEFLRRLRVGFVVILLLCPISSSAKETSAKRTGTKVSTKKSVAKRLAAKKLAAKRLAAKKLAAKKLAARNVQKESSAKKAHQRVSLARLVKVPVDDHIDEKCESDQKLIQAIGNKRIEVTLNEDASGILRAYEGSVEITRLQSKVLGGLKEKPTPSGDFFVCDMDPDHKSSEYRGAPMPFSIFFKKKGERRRGLALHEGSLTVKSHGCIHVAKEQSQELFLWATVCTPIKIIENGPNS